MNKIGFIGAGNMAGSLINGLLNNASFKARDIRASDPTPGALAQQSGIKLMPDNPSLVNWADVVVLAVKPPLIRPICQQIAAHIKTERHLVISIAAGIRSASIIDWLAQPVACVRVMPNTPALIGLGISGLYANPQSSAEQIEIARRILQAVGKVVQFKQESALDAVPAVSGSGPAYFFLLMEAMQKAAVQQGLNEADAKLLVTQTALGATNMATAPDADITQLRQCVTSPGGTTEQAINTLLDGGFMPLVDAAVSAAAQRSVSLSNEMDDTPDE